MPSSYVQQHASATPDNFVVSSAAGMRSDKKLMSVIFQLFQTFKIQNYLIIYRNLIFSSQMLGGLINVCGHCWSLDFKCNYNQFWSFEIKSVKNTFQQSQQHSHSNWKKSMWITSFLFNKLGWENRFTLICPTDFSAKLVPFFFFYGQKVGHRCA